MAFFRSKTRKSKDLKVTMHTILLETKQGSKYLLAKEDLPQIVELASTLQAQVYEATTHCSDSILTIEEFAKCLCDHEYELKAAYVLGNRLIPASPEEVLARPVQLPMPQKVLTAAEKKQRLLDIKNYIRKTFIADRILTLDKIHDEWPDEDLGRTKLSRIFSEVRASLREEGCWLTEMTGKGCYVLKARRKPRLPKSEIAASMTPQEAGAALDALLNQQQIKKKA